MATVESNTEAIGRRSGIRILIVAGADDEVLRLTEHLLTRLDADLAIVETMDEAETLAGTESFDAIVTQRGLPDGDGLGLLRDDRIETAIPVIVLDDELDAERILAALRAGALDVIPRPFDLDRLTVVIREAVEQYRQQRSEAARAKRLRGLSSRMIRDRRELRKRVDLVCRDLVHAYRRLAEKVIEISP